MAVPDSVGLIKRGPVLDNTHPPILSNPNKANGNKTNDADMHNNGSIALNGSM